MKKKLFDKQHLEIIETNFSTPTTLRIIFSNYEFPLIRFSNPSFKFPNDNDENILEITQIKNMKNIFPKDITDDKIISKWLEGAHHFYLYPQILDINLILNQFYEDENPVNYFTSKRINQRKIAKCFYMKIIQYNNCSIGEINNFITNFCLSKSFEKLRWNIVINESHYDSKIKRDFQL